MEIHQIFRWDLQLKLRSPNLSVANFCVVTLKKNKHNEEFDTTNMCIYSGKIGGQGLNSKLRAGRGDRLTVRPLHRTPKLYIFCGLEATK